MTETKARKELEIILFKRNSFVQKIDALYKRSNTLSVVPLSEDELAEFKVRCDKLSGHYDSFNRYQNDLAKIYIQLKETTELDTLQEKTGEVDDKYFHILCVKEKLIPTLVPKPEPSPPVSSNTAKLPKINLPTFQGILKEWPNFRDLYTSLVHSNSSLPEIEKYHYLISCTQGEPNSLVRSLPISAANYDLVWAQLVERYDNKRLLASQYVDEIFNLPPVTTESPKPLRHLLDLLTENTQALKTIDISDLGEFIILHSALKKLDKHTRQLFEREFSKQEFPSLDEFLMFLRNHCKCLDSAAPQAQIPQKLTSNFKPMNNNKFPSKSLHKPATFNPQQKSFLANTNDAQCIFCKLPHSVYGCTEFLKLSPNDRHDFVKSIEACFNCLSPSHMLNKCQSRHRCRNCSKRHHTSLHVDSFVPKPNNSKPEKPVVPSGQILESDPNSTVHNQDEVITKSHHSFSPPNVSTLLGTALVEIQNSAGQFQTIRALIDPGSQSSFISESCVKSLCLRRNKSNQTISGLSQTPVSGARGITSCLIKPRGKTDPKLQTSAIILNQITSSLPTVKLSSEVKQYFQGFDLADPDFHIPASIDFLIGADLFPQVFDGGRLDSPPGFPTPFHSVFGWLLIGRTSLPTQSQQQVISANLAISDQSLSLEASLKRFWEIEEPPISKKSTDGPEDIRCESIFADTHSRDPSGRYIVRLPFKDEPLCLGNSYDRAKQCLLSLERRFRTNPDLKTDYSTFLQEYEKLGHMSRVPPDSEAPTYFIPHHGVYKSDKLRVVFNASAQTHSGQSLNHHLLTGPKLQNDICEILSRFRLHPVVFTTDICKMYRQILVHPDHRPFQAILWRSSEDSPINTYHLNTVTYGVSSAPYLAIRTLHQLASDEGHNYPLAAHALLTDVFVDDCICASPTLEAAIELKNQLVGLLASGGFELRKWTSNTPQLLQDVPSDHCEILFDSDKSELSSVKVLGLKWMPESDAFTYNVPHNSTPSTKRGLLSYISRIFDPLGLVTPTIFWAKHLMQHLWFIGLDWDDPLPPEIYSQWKTFCEELPALATLSIPRFISSYNSQNVQIHGFCDASEAGYASCLYLRTSHADGSVSTRLIIAKSKVAPLKRITIPKLELCGAYILSKLVKFYRRTVQSTQLSTIPIYAWTDSMVCLSWIHTSPHLLKTFVGNRVADIQETINPSHWFHVPSAQNPADCASRGLMPSQLVNQSLWWYGPEWLSLPPSHWPSQEHVKKTSDQASSELRSQVVHAGIIKEDIYSQQFIERFSSLTHLQRVTAWILRFKNNCLNKSARLTSSYLSANELKTATLNLVRTVQSHYLRDQIECIEKDKICLPFLQRLNPFLDPKGIIRVGGRLRNAELNYDAKHPLLLPKQAHLSSLIIDHFHRIHMHIGPRTLQSLIVREFWIVSARSKIRHLLSKCITCVKLKAKAPQPYMADLPKVRLQPCRPFQQCGVDYGGPILTKSDKSRKPQILKSYICLFICLVTRSIHLELVSSLSTDSFLAALSRFISRRGMPTDIYSDQGTNFVGANRELNELLEFISRPNETAKVNTYASQKGIQWHFNPPASPHFGGVWEAGIKSTKYHLKHVIGEQKLTFEELTTLLTQIEAILNSRPLTALSSDPQEVDTLTPGHFLTGAPLLALPSKDLTPLPVNRLSRWQLVQQQTQQFWKRWRDEYLHTLQQRVKWTNRTPNLQIGDLVLVKDANIPVMTWLMGRVMETHPGTDGVVRVVTLRTKQGTLKRPVVKLCLLPTN